MADSEKIASRRFLAAAACARNDRRGFFCHWERRGNHRPTYGAREHVLSQAFSVSAQSLSVPALPRFRGTGGFSLSSPVTDPT